MTGDTFFMQTSTKQLVQAIEVWSLNDQTERLSLCASFYSSNNELASVHGNSEFGQGEGLIGKAWADGTPVIGEISDSVATHMVAIPSMSNGKCHGVVVIFCNNQDESKGAFEIWRPNDRGELALAENWYANLERFGLISQFIKFPRRAGLPGKVWHDRFPRVMGALSTSKKFVRISGAQKDGLAMAVGIPIMKTTRELDSVLLMLSTTQTPIAQVMEVWALDPETEKLQVVSADYGPHVDLAAMSRKVRIAPGEGLAGRVYANQQPWVTGDFAAIESARNLPSNGDRFEWALGIPVFVGEQLTAVVTLIQ